MGRRARWCQRNSPAPDVRPEFHKPGRCHVDFDVGTLPANFLLTSLKTAMRLRTVLLTALLAALLAPPLAAQLPLAPPSPLPDDRLAADILVIVAHPDDEILVIGYLARAIGDEHKKVAVVYATRGDHGANQIGYEQGASLALVREMEARRGLAGLGVLNVWFFDAPNVAEPTEDPLGSLEKWSHGEVLERTVRLIRLIRPKVVITWLPDYVVGENHCDHQAAGVLATEAFDLAGDPLAFPEQVTPPLDYRGYGNLKEGLQPWQAQKLYYFSDASHLDFVKDAGPAYAITGVSPSRRVSYSQLVAEEVSTYLTQGEGIPAQKALAAGDVSAYKQPVQLILGKSLVKGTATGDVFEGVAGDAVPYAPPRGYQPEAHSGLSIELGSPWHFYRQFWQAHNIEHLANLHSPEMGLKSGQTAAYSVPLLLRNDTGQPRQIEVTATLPAGWLNLKGSARYSVRPHSIYPLVAGFSGVSTMAPEWHDVTWQAESDGKSLGSVTLHVYSAPKGSFFEPAGIPGP